MDSGMISKIEKGKRYAEERDQRIHFQTFEVAVEGDNSTHTVRFKDGVMACDCDFFSSRGRCSHTIAMEYSLEGMFPPSTN
jgi:hypothetical protein